MPKYTYACPECGWRHEISHSIHDNTTRRCSCGSDLKRIIAPVAVTFKGSGFYRTDSRKQKTTS